MLQVLRLFEKMLKAAVKVTATVLLTLFIF